VEVQDDRVVYRQPHQHADQVILPAQRVSSAYFINLLQGPQNTKRLQYRDSPTEHQMIKCRMAEH
jgi:hypothetical protein